MSDKLVPVAVSGHAARLARIAEVGVREFLGFVLGPETYALPLSCMREILRVPPITEVPRAAPDVLGVISVRGQVTTLFDLRRRLALPRAAIGAKTRVLLVEQGDELLGLLCDRVLEVYRLNEQQVELASVLGSDTPSYVMGIGRPGLTRGQTLTRSAARKAAVRGATAAEDILILLDPIALLKRHGHG
jgi:purine-binding chemotaxis protein CheW